MTLHPHKFPSLFLGLCLSAIIVLISACGGRGSGKQEDILYVTAPQTFLRDRVAPVYSKTGTVRNGERVALLERGKRWERVRNAAGEEGWLQDRYLVGENVFAWSAAQRIPLTPHPRTRYRPALSAEGRRQSRVAAADDRLENCEFRAPSACAPGICCCRCREAGRK